MKRITLSLAVVMFAFGVSFLPSVPRASVLNAQDRTGIDSEKGEQEHILTIDHFVPHNSTVPANRGDQVELFVRERVKDDDSQTNRVVLMVNEAVHAVATSFDLRFENYSWMAFLAEAGFDVFAMDLQGYGRSPRPTMDDACNTSPQDQDRYLIPNPLPERCDPTYPYRVTNTQSDWDEIDTVVDYLRRQRGVDRVSFVAWSRGCRRLGGYAARHPEKVEKLFLLAPGAYNRLEASEPPAVLPEPGIPMNVQRVGFFPGWDSELSCENQFTPAIRLAIASSQVEFDPVGSTWGEVGVRRSPNQTMWGWNQTFARQIEPPTLVIVGDLDLLQGQIRDFFEDLGAGQKVFVHVECASHTLLWENQHMILLRASEEWLRHGTFAGHTDGSFFVDTDGHVHNE